MPGGKGLPEDPEIKQRQEENRQKQTQSLQPKINDAKKWLQDNPNADPELRRKVEEIAGSPAA